MDLVDKCSSTLVKDCTMQHGLATLVVLDLGPFGFHFLGRSKKWTSGTEFGTARTGKPGAPTDTYPMQKSQRTRSLTKRLQIGDFEVGKGGTPDFTVAS